MSQIMTVGSWKCFFKLNWCSVLPRRPRCRHLMVGTREGKILGNPGSYRPTCGKIKIPAVIRLLYYVGSKENMQKKL